MIVEPEPLVAEALAHPRLLVAAELEDEDAAAGLDDARGFGQGARGRGGMVQRLRQQRHVDAGVLERHVLELAAMPLDLSTFARATVDKPAFAAPPRQPGSHFARAGQRRL